MYDYRGRDGTGTADSPATGSNMQSYTVRKLADGNCWMAENLQLNLSTSHSYKVGTFDGGEADWTPNQHTNDAYNYAINPNYKENIAVTDYRNISHNNWYYTWYGATAGQGTQSVTSESSITQSICPKGWRLPLGDTSNKSFYHLITTKYGLSTGTAINNDPLNFYPSGYTQSSVLYGNVDTGYYSTATPTGDNFYTYYLIFSENYVEARAYSTPGQRCNGLNVRCVSL